MNDIPSAKLKRESRFSYVWIVPLICFVMVTGFGIKYFRDRGPEITVRFPDAETLAVNKTDVQYLGVTVGKMTDVIVSSDTTKPGVLAKIRLDREAGHLAREGTKFLIIKPEVSIAGVQGLSTIFRGATISLIPTEAPVAKEGTIFEGYADARSFAIDKPGLNIRVASPRAAGLEYGDGVYYRGLRVGSVTDSTLAQSSRNIIVTLKIEPKYADLVRDNTVFWDAGGVRAKIGLFGAKIDVDSLQTLMAGGISFATPDQPGARAQQNALFTLESAVKPEWEKWSPSL